MSRFAAIAAALAALGLQAAPAFAAEPHRFALVIGEAKGGPGTRPLRYAERDARRIHGILTRLGGVKESDAVLLLNPDADDFRGAMKALSARSAQSRAAGEATLLLVYYSGHAKDGDLRMGDSRLPMEELREALKGSAADVRIGFIDSCQSGAITRTKGVRKAPAFEVDKERMKEAQPKGLVLIASSSADEESQESDEIAASFFTHYLASGLLGDADASGDGKVTLAEAYAYAYGRTVGSTTDTAAGAQHPVFLYDLGGTGDVVLTDLAPAAGGIRFPSPLDGLFVVLDGGRRAIAEVAKSAGAPRSLSLAAGNYTVKKRTKDGLLLAEVEVKGGFVEVDEARMRRVPFEKDPQKGESGTRWTLLTGMGYQHFFDQAASTGLFPDAALGGFELGARGDLGHDLAWGLDLSFGGGTGSATATGTAAFPFRFTEMSGGASLWRDIDLGDFNVALGARIAFIRLDRSFPTRPDFPAQYFFTVTPGLEGQVGWRVWRGISAVARGRLNYLFYNVDEKKNLGYAEVSMGIEYAFGY